MAAASRRRHGPAARYAFSDIARVDALFADALAALPHDPTGELLARACARARSVQVKGSRVASAAQALPGFLLERSLPAAGKALLLRAVSLSADRPHT